MSEEPTFGTAALIVSSEMTVFRPHADFIGEVQKAAKQLGQVRCELSLGRIYIITQRPTSDHTAMLVVRCDQVRTLVTTEGGPEEQQSEHRRMGLRT